MRIFLSGKVSTADGDWRTKLVGSRYDRNSGDIPNWTIRRNGCVWDSDSIPEWPREPNTLVLGLHEYTGPYRIEFTERESYQQCSGDFHGSEVPGFHCVPDEASQMTIAGRCLAAIRKSDMVFAVINTPDCFGTIAEIGYAHACGKFVYLVVAHDKAQWEWNDYWFVQQLTDGYTEVSSEDGELPIQDLFKTAVVQWATTVSSLHTNEPPAPNLTRSLSAIQRWTSDPRARQEASRALDRMGRGD
jgi:hypothetical protein